MCIYACPAKKKLSNIVFCSPVSTGLHGRDFLRAAPLVTVDFPQERELALEESRDGMLVARVAMKTFSSATLTWDVTLFVCGRTIKCTRFEETISKSLNFKVENIFFCSCFLFVYWYTKIAAQHTQAFTKTKIKGLILTKLLKHYKNITLAFPIEF